MGARTMESLKLVAPRRIRGASEKLLCYHPDKTLSYENNEFCEIQGQNVENVGLESVIGHY